jgi:subtilisin family serine protease
MAHRSPRRRPAHRVSWPRVAQARLAAALGLAIVAGSALAPAVAASGAGAAGGGPSTAAAPAPLAPAQKLRGDLADQVAGTRTLDARIPGLIPAWRTGDLAYFAVLSEPDDAAHAAVLASLGARVLRSYRSVEAFALTSSPTTVLRVAALGWVTRLEPIEVVVALDHEPVADQTRGTPADVGASQLWARGIIGSGVRIAVLDTGYDPSHPDLDDRDFGHWTAALNPSKVVDARNFNGGGCAPLVGDGHGHGTHVASIAAGTGEGIPSVAGVTETTAEDGEHAGIAPGAELAIGKVLTDAGAGINSDLIAALEWAAMPAEIGPTGCAVGADVVNLSLGSESRPSRLNSGADIDLVSAVANQLAVRYGTLIVSAVGNSGPYVGSALETVGSASQVMSVGAASKDWDLNHDDTASGDTCSGWQHPPSGTASDNACTGGEGTQGPSVAAFSSRGPSGDLWLRPDLVAPGYNIVAAQAASGSALAANDYSANTRNDPLYATASGTSMASPAAAGAAALLLDAYRQAHAGADPAGPSGLAGIDAPTYVLLRAALMNSAAADLYEARWILTLDAGVRLLCPPDVDPLAVEVCVVLRLIQDTVWQSLGSLSVYEVRNGASDPFVGPLAEGAGKLRLVAALEALSGGVVIYSAASGSGASAGTGPRDYQGSWQVGAISAGATQTQQFVLRSAPGSPATDLTFSFEAGHPSDGSRAISPAGADPWTVTLPAATALPSGEGTTVAFTVRAPAGAAPGSHTGAVVVRTGAGQVIRIPVFASVSLHDADPAAGNTPGPQAQASSGTDVYAKGDTTWPSAAGAALGAAADWLVFPVELAGGLSEARLSVVDAAAGDETYDLYLYDRSLDLVASSHPFAADGTTDVAANNQRGPSTAAAPTVVSLAAPAAGRYYVAVNRARIGQSPLEGAGDFGAYRLTLDEIGATGSARPSALAYGGDQVVTQGSSMRLAATLTDDAGRPIAGRTITFVLDGATSPCPGGTCSATTSSDGLAQLATDPITLAAGIHEVRASFGGDSIVGPSSSTAFILVIGTGLPSLPGGTVNGGAWFVPDGRTAGKGDVGRVHLAVHASGSVAPSGQLRFRDDTAGLDLTLASWTSLAVSGSTATLTGTARTGAGSTIGIRLEIVDGGEPGKGRDRVRVHIPTLGYDVAGLLGGGNLQVRP